MSTEITHIKSQRGEIDITEFCGPKGLMLQISQGLGLGADEPGFIQLDLQDSAALMIELAKWIKSESSRRANALKKKIDEDKIIERTIFNDAVECEKFIAAFEVPRLSIRFLLATT